MVSLARKFKLRSARAKRRKFLKSTFSQVPRKKKYPSKSSNIKALRVVVAAAAVILVYFLFYSPYFKISSVVVLDCNITNEKDIEDYGWSVLNKMRYYVLPGKNIFIFDEKLLRKTILEKIPEIDSIEITRKYPNIIKIKVKEAKMAAIWNSNDHNYYLDENGMIRGEVENFDQSIFTISDLNNREVQLRENVVYAKHINFIRNLYEKLPEINVEIESVSLPSPLANEVHVTTVRGWRVFLTLERELDQQISNLQLVFENEINNQLTEDQLDYVDLRVESWVYYRRRMAEKSQAAEESEEEPEEYLLEDLNDE